MATGAKTTGQSYYDPLPTLDQQVGDLWRGLPAFGHLRMDACSGIVITPACDLANRKVETITYLPVVTVRDYLLSRGFAVELARIVKGQGQVAKLSNLEGWQVKGISLPSDDVMRKTHEAAELVCSVAGAKEKEAASRVCAAVSVLRKIRGESNGVDINTVRVAIGIKEYDRCISEIVRNAYAPDIHFLPSDGRSGDFSVMESHSVALFRYPIAVPVELLDAANDVAVTDWAREISNLRSEFPVVAFAERIRPVKVGALRPRFLPDLISRFAALHIRMGSPDFTRETVEDFVKEFREVEL